MVLSRVSQDFGHYNNKNSIYFLVNVCDEWHRRLGHPSNNTLSEVMKLCNVKVKYNDKVSFCETCQFGKSHFLPFKPSTSHATFPLDLIHTDL